MERPRGLEPQHLNFKRSSGIPVLRFDGKFPDTIVQVVDGADTQSEATHLSNASGPDAASDSGDSSTPDAPAPAPRGARDVPVKVDVPGGTTGYHPKHDRFYRHCAVDGLACRRCRTAKDEKDGMPRRPERGRPIGALAAWLADAGLDESVEGDRFLAPRYSLAQRKAAREAVKASGVMARLLMTHERPQRAGEDSEAEGTD